MHGHKRTDLPLVTRPCDEIHYVGSCHWKNRFGRSEWSQIYVVAHRQPHEQDGQGSYWTHIYRIAEDTRGGRPLVYLETVFQGDCMVLGLAVAKQLIGISDAAAQSGGSRQRPTHIGRAA
jgi:hypothetical protein